MRLSALDDTLKSVRARRVLEDIAFGEKRLMPCGDQRIAALLYRFGAVIIVNAKDRRFNTSYEVTELGLSKIENKPE